MSSIYSTFPKIYNDIAKLEGLNIIEKLAFLTTFIFQDMYAMIYFISGYV